LVRHLEIAAVAVRAAWRRTAEQFLAGWAGKTDGANDLQRRIAPQRPAVHVRLVSHSHTAHRDAVDKAGDGVTGLVKSRFVLACPLGGNAPVSAPTNHLCCAARVVSRSRLLRACSSAATPPKMVSGSRISDFGF